MRRTKPWCGAFFMPCHGRRGALGAGKPKMDNACFGMYAMVRGVGGTGDNLLKSVAQDSTKFVKKVK
jgi:hypothetical protein